MNTLVTNPAIIKAAAKMITIGIQSIESSLDEYPDTKSYNLNSVVRYSYLPASLLTFMKCIFVGQTIACEIACIGQVNSAHPRTVIALIQLGLGVQLGHHFRSRLLIFI